MADSQIFKAKRIANPGLTECLTDHAFVVDGGVINEVMPSSALPEAPGARFY